jgi:CheY-like chemotaxis protein
VSSSCDTLRDAKILVVSDAASDAEMVRAMLCAEFRNVVAATAPKQVANDFDRYQPEVLILVFNTLEKTQAYDRELFRLSKLASGMPHRTVILCSKDEMQAAYTLCRQERFNDYVLFWPLAHDAPRLPMAVTNALRDMQHSKGAVTAKQAADMARQITELEGLLVLQFENGQLRVQAVSQSAVRVGVNIHAAIDNFAKKIMRGDLADVLSIRDSARLQHEFDQFRTLGVQPCLQTLHHEMQPLMQWVEDMQGLRASRVAAATATIAAAAKRAEHFQPLVMVVDDSEFERKLMGKLLDETLYELAFAASGAEALGILRQKRPDLILMDLDMPVLNGLEILRKLKAAPQFADIPVMMVTGQSGKGIVVECLQAGAVDFVVKPLERDAFLKKIERFLT